uniref:non-specific serine/threonine protein kinase n=1 Tax=Petromyzon marinus TaxID=7757 RepID=A0AAJ7SIS3_PETMA|nr:serine/threonine-protein kinase Nek8-like [Petromyzon marinus]
MSLRAHLCLSMRLRVSLQSPRAPRVGQSGAPPVPAAGGRPSALRAVHRTLRHRLLHDVTSSGRLLACGSNRYNKLGLDKISHDGDDAACPAEQTEESLVLSPVQSSPLDGARVVHVALGTAHSAAVTDTGTCYTFGSNQHGQLGGGARTSSRAPQPVDGLGGVKVVQVTCGDAFTVAVADSDDDAAAAAGAAATVCGGGGLFAQSTWLRRPIINIVTPVVIN